jgi:hypothetical protein
MVLGRDKLIVIFFGFLRTMDLNKMNLKVRLYLMDNVGGLCLPKVLKNMI